MCSCLCVWVCWVWEQREERSPRTGAQPDGWTNGEGGSGCLPWHPSLTTPHTPLQQQEHTLPAGAQSLGELRQEVQRRFGLGEGQPFVLTAMDRTELTEGNFRVRFCGFGVLGGVSGWVVVVCGRLAFALTTDPWVVVS